MARALEVLDLVLRYGKTMAVNGATFSASAGRVTAVVGPNGAGKTSIIETCEGYRKPASGSVRVLGLDPRADAKKLRPKVGVMLQDGGVASGARPLDALVHMASLYRNPVNTAALGERLGLAGIDTTYRRMSGGEQQRLKFAIALVGRPEFVFLDEPTAGLDAAAKHIVWELISELRNHGVTVLLSTHLMDDVERLADQVVVVQTGRIVANGTPDDLLGSAAGELSFLAPIGLNLTGLRETLPNGTDVTEGPPGKYRVSGTSGPQTLATLTKWCAEQEVMPRELATGRRRLEDVVIELTTAQDSS